VTGCIRYEFPHWPKCAAFAGAKPRSSLRRGAFLEDRVRAHVLIAMLAAYLRWWIGLRSRSSTVMVRKSRSTWARFL